MKEHTETYLDLGIVCKKCGEQIAETRDIIELDERETTVEIECMCGSINKVIMRIDIQVKLMK